MYLRFGLIWLKSIKKILIVKRITFQYEFLEFASHDQCNHHTNRQQKEGIHRSFLKIKIIVLILFHYRNRPQMVKIHKLTGDFNVAEIRESFMRQFITPQLDLIIDTDEGVEEGQSFLRRPHVNLVRCSTLGTRSGGTTEKQLGVAAVIRFVNNTSSELEITPDV